MAAIHDFVIEQGATFGKSVQWRDTAGEVIDIQGYSARMQIRADDFLETLQIELTTLNGKLSISPENKVVMSVSAVDTSALIPGIYVYDLELEKDGVVTRLIQGSVVVSKEVTK